MSGRRCVPLGPPCVTAWLVGGYSCVRSQKRLQRHDEQGPDPVDSPGIVVPRRKPVLQQHPALWLWSAHQTDSSERPFGTAVRHAAHNPVSPHGTVPCPRLGGAALTTSRHSLSVTVDRRCPPAPPALLALLLQNLVVVNLTQNQLSGTIPSPLFTVTSLVSLDLSRNLLSGPVDGASSLSRLTFFSVAQNAGLNGTLPAQWPSLKVDHVTPDRHPVTTHPTPFMRRPTLDLPPVNSNLWTPTLPRCVGCQLLWRLLLGLRSWPAVQLSVRGVGSVQHTFVG